MFSRTNPFDEIVTTSERLRSSFKKLTRRLAQALVKNCDLTVHREISSRNFTAALVKIINDKTTHDTVRKRALELIQACAFDFRSDPSLGLMNETYLSLRSQGVQFPSPQKPKKETQSELDKQKEEEEFQLALALSLSESESKAQFKAPSKSTPSASQKAPESQAQSSEPAKPSRVRALYDFQPTEQGELGFQKGDIIRVLESVYRDWWKGELRGKTGIFPVNYVEKIVDPSPADLAREAQMEDEVMDMAPKVEQLIAMLSKIDPRRDSFAENEQLQTLYNQTLAVRPKLVKLIEKYSLKKDELVALNEKFMKARTSYDKMLESSIARYSSPPADPYGQPQPHYAAYPPAQAEPYPNYPQQPQPRQDYYGAGSQQLPPQQQPLQHQPVPTATPDVYAAYQPPQASGGYYTPPAPQQPQPQPQQQQQQQQQPQPQPPNAYQGYNTQQPHDAVRWT
ncbi:ESCRT-0 subunit protein hse1 [Umbelopsis nana]